MRLTHEQSRNITQTVAKILGTTAKVYLFGSRTDDQARGGDVDLLLETDTPLSLLDRARIKMELETRLGLPFDIVSYVSNQPRTPFQTIARAQAMPLETP
jgi:predicted nucleotidyltransferase